METTKAYFFSAVLFLVTIAVASSVTQFFFHCNMGPMLIVTPEGILCDTKG